VIDPRPDRFGDALGRAVLRRVGEVASRIQERTPLDADVLESDDAYLVVFDAPGVDPRDVDVTVDGTGVSVRFERFRAFHEGFETVMAGRGRSLRGRAELPADAAVDADEAHAELEDDGTLSVFVPKAARVPVEDGDANDAADGDGDATSADDDATGGGDDTTDDDDDATGGA